MEPADQAYPCPKCSYDLRGLPDGRCPECGRAFVAAELKPEIPGLALEHWYEAADTWKKRALLPWKIALAPIRAFRHDCRLEKTLATSPGPMLHWFLLWCLLLVPVSMAARLPLITSLGLPWPFGLHWLVIAGRGFDSFGVLLLHILWVGLQCMAAVVIGMIISFRWLPLPMLARLAMWMLPFTLVASLCRDVASLVQCFLPLNWEDRLSDLEIFGHYFYITGFARSLSGRLLDTILGILTGLAVGTVFLRRRWLIVLILSVLFTAGYDVYLRVHAPFYHFWSYRLYLWSGGPEQDALPPLTVAPTFAVGTTDASMAGRWELRYLEQPEIPPGAMTFDADGSLVRYVAYDQKLGRNIEFDADGAVHDVDTDIESDELRNASTSYRVLSGCQREGGAITLNIRVEMMMWTRVEGRLMGLELVTEEHFSGLAAEDGSQISGTSVLCMEAPGIRPEPNGLERPFVMIRLSGPPKLQPASKGE
jgi:hypothetical protein